MLIPTENKCFQCKRVFCCSTCRVKHERQVHTVLSVPLQPNNPHLLGADCVLCAGGRFTLQKLHSNELIQHLSDKHLPLRCNKCNKVFSTFGDLLTVTACKLNRESCELRSKEEICMPPTDKYGQLLPPLEQALDHNKSVASSATFVNDDKENNMNSVNDSHMTPITQWNLRWKSKIGSGLLTDSISSIRNVSSLTNSSNIQHSQITQSPQNQKHKLTRQTSTPMQRCMQSDLSTANLMQQRKANSFDSINTTGQISSICTPNVSSGSDSSPTEPISRRATPPKHRHSRMRNKLPPSATPLRQVMSRSIQKAIVQHGLPNFLPTRMRYSPATPRSPASTPLDLRTSPVIRRTNSTQSLADSSHSSCSTRTTQSSVRHVDDVFYRAPNRPVSNLQSSDEAVVSNSPPNHLIDSVYESCKSYDAEDDCEKPESNIAVPTSIVEQTPKRLGAVMKTGSFAERQAAPWPSCYAHMEETTEQIFEASLYKSEEKIQPTDEVAEVDVVDDDPVEEWYTPCTKLRKSSSCIDRVELVPSAIEYSPSPETGKCSKVASFQATYRTSDSESSVFEENDQLSDQTEGSSSDPGGAAVEPSTSKVGLWSIVSSVMRLASFGHLERTPNAPGVVAATLLKKSATFAGIITSSTTTDAPNTDNAVASTNKRRRTLTAGSLSEQSPSKQHRRIIGRPPLKRMRHQVPK